MSNTTPAVELFLTQLEHPMKAGVASLRAAILASNSEITERIKWSAPSFCIGGEDRVTFKLRPADTVQLIFHRGAKVKDTTGFTFEDPSGLLQWVAADRGIVTFEDTKTLKAKQAALVKLVNRWMKATAGVASVESGLPKIGAPATRALAGVGITTLKQLTHRTESELAGLHGMGPKALGLLREALAAQGLSFGMPKKRS